MKRLYLIYMIVLTVAISCDKEEVHQSDRVAILLEANKSEWNSSRSASYTGNAGTNPIPDMVVYGYYTHDLEWSEERYGAFPSFMNGAVVTNNQGVWGYSPLKYFYHTGNHSFFALAPYSIINADERNVLEISNILGTPQLIYNLPNEEIDQVDILYGVAIDKTKADGQTPINLNFVHATTQIIFSAGYANGFNLPINHKVRIKSISISNIYSQGKLKSKYDLNDEYDGIEWDEHDILREQTVNIGDNTLRDANLTNTIEKISTDNGSLFLIPQLLTGRNVADRSSILILYEIKNTISGTSKDYTQTIELADIIGELIAGQKLNFRISYSGSGTAIEVKLVDPGSGNPDGLGPPLGQSIVEHNTKHVQTKK